MTDRIEKHVASLELSKKLKELGVPQKSYFLWRSDGGNLFYPSNNNYEYEFSHGCVSAFLSSELGEMLKKINCSLENLVNKLSNVSDGFAQIMSLDYWMLDPDNLAEVLIYLIENNLVEVNDDRQNN